MESDRQDRDIVLITGSSGLIGSAVTDALSKDYRVVGLDLDPPRDPPPGVDCQRCDLSDPEALERAMDAVREGHGRRFASVVHLAAYYDFTGEPSPLYEELTVRGTSVLLRILQDFEVEQFLFSSSLLALRPSEDGEPLTEDSPLEGEWDYPESKIRAEAVIHEERRAIPAVILRLAGIYDEEGHSPPITNQISRIHQKELESYFFPGDATRGQSFVHLEDAVEAIRLAVERRGELGAEEVFLIGEPEVLSYKDLQERIGELIHGEKWPAIRIPKALAKAGAWIKSKIGDDEEFIQPWMIDLADAHYPVSIERAVKRLGWQPRHRLRSTLPEIIRRLKENPRRWYEENGIDPPE